MSAYTVIGAAGFIGSRLTERLRRDGHEVYAPARGDPDIFGRDLGRLLYCAGLTGDYRERPFDAVEAHVTLLARILSEAKFERIVYLSSTRLYETQADRIGREDRPLPLDPADTAHVYELSKALGENLTINQSQGRGVAARLSYVFDETDSGAGFLSEWLARARSSRSLTLESSPSNARDYIHLDDVVDALMALADSGVGGVVNVAGGRTLSNAAIAEIFRRHGWEVVFSRPPSLGEPVACDIARLTSLGVRPRDVRDLIDRYLAGLAAQAD